MKNKKQKIIIISVFAALCVATALLYVATLVLPNVFDDAELPGTNGSMIFYPIDFNEDITKNLDYMGLDRNFYFYMPDTNTTISFDPDDLGDVNISYREGVEFVCKFVREIIAGNTDGYNACFSEAYYASDGTSRHTPFTAQKLYEITITAASFETNQDQHGREYTSFTFGLNYKIFQNNGSYRRIESDMETKQMLLITNRDGEYLIDGVREMYTQYIDSEDVGGCGSTLNNAIIIPLVCVFFALRKKRL